MFIQLMFDKFRQDTTQQRAVSPVIGVILMVAITVILAAVIGAFVLEIGDQQEQAPSTSFDTDERMTYLKLAPGSSEGFNMTQVGITVAGGDSLPISQTQIAHDGNTSVWARPGGENSLTTSAWKFARYQFRPQPDICETAGTNAAVEWTAGQSFFVEFSGGTTFRDFAEDHPLPSDEQLLNDAPIQAPGQSALTPTACSGEYVVQWNKGDINWVEAVTAATIVGRPAKVLRAGDTVSVVWEAQSGGKTQQLHKYSVQTSSKEP
jgi:flagellin-like protein